jgi:hypothetical protein
MGSQLSYSARLCLPASLETRINPPCTSGLKWIMGSRLYSKHYMTYTNIPADFYSIQLADERPRNGKYISFLNRPSSFLVVTHILRKCYVVRKDRKPLSKEVFETMYEFHSSILDTDYFMDKMSGHAPYEITPKVFQDFADNYWREQASFEQLFKDRADGRPWYEDWIDPEERGFVEE